MKGLDAVNITVTYEIPYIIIRMKSIFVWKEIIEDMRKIICILDKNKFII